ncbi:WXG100 family type VII secretion target [Streptomyces sp. NPDC008092]|uniref:WXG100 family type VII secretion target n=1 Tax=Streptomyces sp. NPDC008092 TaxID=3364808 RepID=UPI0036E6687F
MAGNVDGANLVVRPELAHAGDDINKMAQTIADELYNLNKQLQPVLAGGDWTGDAQRYFEGLEAEWTYAAHGLFGPDGVLGEIAHAMHVNWNNYAEAEWSNGRTWQHH